MKRCPKCGVDKPKAEFYKSSQTKSGIAVYCKDCSRGLRKRFYYDNRSWAIQQSREWRKQNPEKLNAQGRDWRARNRERARATRAAWAENNRDKRLEHSKAAAWKYRYGLNRTEYKQFFVDHGSKCAICSTEKNLVIDHCHESGRLRGVLCRKCNLAIGHFDDDPKRIESAIKFLEKHNDTQV